MSDPILDFDGTESTGSHPTGVQHWTEITLQSDKEKEIVVENNIINYVIWKSNSAGIKSVQHNHYIQSSDNAIRQYSASYHGYGYNENIGTYNLSVVEQNGN